MKEGKCYTIDEEVIKEIDKEAEKRSVSASWLANEFFKEKLKELKGGK